MHRTAALAAILLAGFASTALAQAGGKIPWSREPLSDVLVRAAKAKKPVMAYFHADW